MGDSSGRLPRGALRASYRAAAQQGDLFTEAPKVPHNLLPFQDLFESTKITLNLPNDLLEAIRIAARVEKTTRAQLIIDILTSAMSRMPEWPHGDEDFGDCLVGSAYESRRCRGFHG